MSFLAGLSIGMLLMLVISLILGGRVILGLRKERKVINDRFEAAAAELESHVRRLNGGDKADRGKEKVS